MSDLLATARGQAARRRATPATGAARLAPLALAFLLLLAHPAAAIPRQRFFADPPWSFTSSRVADPEAYPYTAVGKLLAYDPWSGQLGACSAAVVRSRSRATVVTAAHCVHTGGSGGPDNPRGGGHWYTALLFLPAYGNHRLPLGAYVWEAAAVTRSWQEWGNLHGDVAAIRLYPGPGGRVEDVTGGLTLDFRLPQGQNRYEWTVLGYSVNHGNGEVLWRCQGQTGAHEPEALPYGDGDGSNYAMGCDMEEGSSGGPWVRNLSASRDCAGCNLLASVVSHGLDAERFGDNVVGPWLGAEAEAAVAQVQAGEGGRARVRVASRENRQRVAEVLAFWTPERIARAKPWPLRRG